MGCPMSSGDFREIERLIRLLGYTEVRNNGHTVYTHDAHPQLILAGSPSDRRWKANVMGELRRRHPELRRKKADPEVRAARRRTPTRQPNRTPTVPLTPEERRRINSRPSVAERLGIEVVEHHEIPNPGSPDAQDLGCSCPVFENNRGLGIDGQPGVFVYLVGCLLHEAEPPPDESSDSARLCQCGNPLPTKRAGRPRTWCRSCRPSKWEQSTEEQRESARARYRRWYARNMKKERL